MAQQFPLQAHLIDGRQRLKLRAWLAEVNGLPVGSAVAQQFGGFLGPARLQEVGYISGVYVSSGHRQQVRLFHELAFHHGVSRGWRNH